MEITHGNSENWFINLRECFIVVSKITGESSIHVPEMACGPLFYQAHYTDNSIIFADIRTRLYRGADKSLARPTSRCRMTDSIVSLERDVCSCPELQVFSCYGSRKEACQATREFCRCSLFPPWPG